MESHGAKSGRQQMTIDIPIIATAFVLGLIILVVIVIMAMVGSFRIFD
jgi:hypothetical protein